MDRARVPVRGDAGVVLVILLVVVLALALVGLAMANNVIREAQIVFEESAAAEAHYLAEAGIAVGAAQLAQDNTWVGPLTESLGPGSFTVRVDTAVSTSSIKSIVSQGQVGASPAAAQQTIRETVMALPKAFAKALVSNTVITVSNPNDTNPNVQNTVLPHLGSIHANNLNNESPAVSIQNLGTTVTGQVTSSRGSITIDLLAACIACDPATTQAVIPFPTFNWAHYMALALTTPSPCPGINGTGMLFTSQATFDLCVGALPADAQGFRTLSGIIFIQVRSFTLPHTLQERNLHIAGTLAVYTAAGGGCRSATPCGDLVFAPTASTLTFTAQNGEPAIMTGGSILSTGILASSSISVTGLMYILANTTDPMVNRPANPGYSVQSGATAVVTIRGALVAERANAFTSHSLTFDPSVFPQLPSGLNPLPLGSFTLLPISWSK